MKHLELNASVYWKLVEVYEQVSKGQVPTDPLFPMIVCLPYADEDGTLVEDLGGVWCFEVEEMRAELCREYWDYFSEGGLFASFENVSRCLSNLIEVVGEYLIYYKKMGAKK